VITAENRIFCPLVLLAFVTGCGGGNGTAAPPSQSAAAPPPQSATATRIEQRYPAQTANLITNSATLGGWTLQGGFILEKGGHGAELIGSGSASKADIYSRIITVVPTRKYTFSVWADPSRFTKGKPILMFVSRSRSVAYGPQFHFSGAAGRFSGTVIIPKDITQVRLDVSCAGGTIAEGQKFKLSQPVLSADGVSTLHTR